MTNQFVKYVVNLFKDVPVYVYEVLGLVFFIGTVLMLTFGGFRKGIRYSCRSLIAEYVILLFSSTVLYRSYRKRLKNDFHPFWSYDALQNGGEKLLPEIIMNVVVFVPVGLMQGCAFKNMTWWKVLLIGSGVSVCIETMQYYFQRGFAETDDVMHNTLGSMIGLEIMTILRIIFKTRYNNV